MLLGQYDFSLLVLLLHYILALTCPVKVTCGPLWLFNLGRILIELEKIHHWLNLNNCIVMHSSMSPPALAVIQFMLMF